jgi:putative redox protein
MHYSLRRHVFIEGDLTEEQRQRLLEISGKCPIHRLLQGEVVIETALG